MNWWITLRGRGRNAAIALQTAVRHAVDDPVLLALQVTRTMPHSAQKRIGFTLSRLPGAGLQALGAQLQGAAFPAAARLALQDPAHSPWERLQKRLCAEVALSYGEVDWHDENLPPITRARAAWDMGAVTAAIELAQQAGSHSYARRLRGELQLLTPGFEMAVPSANGKEAGSPNSPHVSSSEQRITAVHLLTNSLPATQSGYTLRSQRLLQAVATRPGIDVVPFTRTGYPVMIGQLTAATSAQVEGLTYRRVLPLRLGATQVERAAQFAAYVLRCTTQLLNREHPAGSSQGNAGVVVHTTTNYPNALAAQSVAHALGAPWVYEVRGIMEETWVSNKKTADARLEAEQSERFSLIRARETEMMQAADHVLTLSTVMKDLLVRRGISAEKITVVPNAVDDSLFTRNLTPESARQTLGLATDGFWVGSVSSLVDYEGFDTLLRTVALLRSRGVDARALLVGDGVARAGLEKIAEELGLHLGSTAVFLGRVAPEKAYIAHQALNVFVVPRKNVRVALSVTPLKPIEAMALGRAVVASDIPPLAELINNEVSAPAGLLAPPEDPEGFARQLDRLREDPELYRYVVESGRAFARTRTWAHNAQSVEKVYCRLLKERYGG